MLAVPILILCCSIHWQTLVQSAPELNNDTNRTETNRLEVDPDTESPLKDAFPFEARQLETARNRWQRTFREIKTLTGPTAPLRKKRSISLNNSTASAGWFNRWKRFLKEDYGDSDEHDELSTWNLFFPTTKSDTPSSKWSWKRRNTTPFKANVGNDSFDPTNTPSKLNQRVRFDGVTTWENLLQQWADDATEYLSTIGNYTSTRSLSSLIMLRDKEKTTSTSKILEALFSKTQINATQTIQRKKTSFIPRPVLPGEPVLPHTDIADKSKNIWIVTTAALPWMTGTAVNPLLRAAYLCEARCNTSLTNHGNVTLMIPWLEKTSDRDKLYGQKYSFETCLDQERFIRSWLQDTANMPIAANHLFIEWYVGWLEPLENSVYGMGDIIGQIPVERADICVLEEPEHLNWYRAPGESWTRKFKHVVGIVHTNYFVYAQDQPAALIRAPALRLLCSWMCRAHSHRLIKLSGTLGVFAPEKELVENVHGVRQTFLDYGTMLCDILQDEEQRKTHPVFGSEAKPTIYFIGKMLWSKGIGSLMDLIKYAEETSGLKLQVDMYGGGPDKEEAASRSKRLNLDMTFHGPIDHAALSSTHKIFVNPSTSEVLCTTVAESLAMGKFVVVPSHASNDFFAQFPNCLTYTTKEEFIGNIYYALTHAPEPLTEEYAYALSWHAAMERFEAAGSISVAEAEAMSDAVSSAETSIEIDLPPLIEDEERRKQISQTVKRTRYRFRQFRSKLSQEIRLSNVLPKDLQQRLISELDKRLDVDVDTLLGSPKLKIQLSPAELDKQLLDLYNNLSESPSGDVLRVIGGGSTVGRQNYYLRQQALKSAREKRNFSRQRATDQLQPIIDGDDSTASTWVQRALRRNLVESSDNMIQNISSEQTGGKESDRLQMKCHNLCSSVKVIQKYALPGRSVGTSQFCHHRQTTRLRYQPLI